MIIRICEICGKEYFPHPKAKFSKYCSNSCKKKAHRKRNPERYNELRRKSYRRPINYKRINEENKRNYKNHRDERLKYRKKIHEKFKDRWYSGLFCDFCGSEGPLDFHHINPKNKKYEISDMRNKKSLEVLSELAKCIVLCHSCHSKYHWKIRKEVKSCV